MEIDWYSGLIVVKDPDAVLDFAWDFGAHVNPWLESGDSLASHTAVAETGLTVDSSAISGDQVVVWVSGGTAGESYDVTVQVTTVAGRVTDRTVTFQVEER